MKRKLQSVKIRCIVLIGHFLKLLAIRKSIKSGWCDKNRPQPYFAIMTSHMHNLYKPNPTLALVLYATSVVWPIRWTWATDPGWDYIYSRTVGPFFTLHTALAFSWTSSPSPLSWSSSSHWWLWVDRDCLLQCPWLWRGCEALVYHDHHLHGPHKGTCWNIGSKGLSLRRTRTLSVILVRVMCVQRIWVRCLGTTMHRWTRYRDRKDVRRQIGGHLHFFMVRNTVPRSLDFWNIFVSSERNYTNGRMYQ